MPLFKSGWRRAFTMEPLDIAAKKTVEQAKGLAQAAQTQAYGNPNGLPSLNFGFGGRSRRTRSAPQPLPPGSIRAGDRGTAADTLPALPYLPGNDQGGGGGGVFGKLRDVGGSLLDAEKSHVLPLVAGAAGLITGRVNATDAKAAAQAATTSAIPESQLAKIPDKPFFPLRRTVAGVTSPLGAATLPLGGGEGSVVGNILKNAASVYGGEVGGDVAAAGATKVGAPAPVVAGARIAGNLAAGAGTYKLLEDPASVDRVLAAAQGRRGRLAAIGAGTEDVTKNPAQYGREVTVPSDVHPDTNYQFRYKVVDLGDLRASHDPYTFAENPDYIQGVQPRNRGDVASQQQVTQLARNLDANKMLAETGDLQNGVPIVGSDNIVESGNGRTMAMMRAARDHPERYQNYVSALKSKLGDFGLSEEALAGKKNPILVRERVSPVANRAAFADEANGSSTLRMGTSETARTDASKISDAQLHSLDIPEGHTLEDALRTQKANPLVRSFMDQLPPTERGALMDSNGQLTQAGMQRLKVAVFQKTYPGESGARLLGDFFESADPAVRNVRAGLEQSLPAMAQVEAGIRAGRIDPALSITKDVADAADVFRRLKAGQLQFKNANDYLAQIGMFGDNQLSPTAQDILRFMEQNNRAPKQLREALRSYAAAVDNLPPPGQAGMFGGELAAPDSRKLWEAVTGRIVPEPEVSQPGMDLSARATSSTRPEASAPTSTEAVQTRSEPIPTESSASATSDGSLPNNSVEPSTASSALPRDASEGSQGVSTTESVARARTRRVRNKAAASPAETQPPQGAADAVFGEPNTSGANTPPSAPPTPPSEPPPPREPGTGNPQRAFGQTGGPVDLLASQPTDQLIAAKEAAAGSRINKTRVGRFLSGVAKGTDSSITNPRVQVAEAEKQRLSTLIPDLVAQKKEQLMADARDAGLVFEPPADATQNGWQISAGGQSAPVRDVVEGATDVGRAVRAALTDQQRAVLDDAATFIDRVNKTKEFYGGTVSKVDTQSGDFWPSKVIGKRTEGSFVEKSTSQGQGRSLRDSRGGSRTTASQSAGQEAGNVYSNPWDAWEGSVKNKLMDAADLHLADIVKPLAVDAQPGFGVTTLKGRHPLLTKPQVTGSSSGGASFLVDQPLSFPADIAPQIDAVLSPSSILDSKPGQAASAVNSVATPLRAAADVSSRFNQGLGFFESAIGNPKNAVKAAKAGVQVFWSAIGHPEAYDNLMRGEQARTRALLEQAGITGPAADEWMVQRGVHYSGANSIDEMVFPKGLESKPGIGQVIRFSNDDFQRFTNYARATLANDALERALGKGLTGEELSNEMRGAIKSVNRMTGWTATKTSGLENIALFAPRYFRSEIEQVASAFKGGLEGSIARRHLFKLVATAGALAYGVNTARGYDTELNPTDPNFLAIRNVFGHDVKLLGPFATLVSGAAAAVTGDLGSVAKFGRAKSSPLLSTAITLAKGRTYEQRPIEQNPLSKDFYTQTIPQMAREAVPFAAQAGISAGIEPAIRNRDPKALATGVAAAGLSALGLQASEVTPAEKRGFKRDAVAQQLYGQNYDALTGEQKAKVNQDPGVAKLQRDVVQRGLDNADQVTQIDQQFRTKIDANDRFLAAGKDDAGNPFTGIDYRKAYDDAAAARAVALKTIGQDTSGDLGGYFALRDKATQANGQVNYDQLDQLQADYIAAHPSVVDQLDKAVGSRDTPTMQRLRTARAQAKDYYALPAYQGLTAEQGQRASTVLAQAATLTASGQAAGYKDALLRLKAAGAISDTDITFAVRAQRAGSNPARKQFTATHPEFAEFYKGANDAFGAVGSVAAASSGGGGQSAFRPSNSSGGSATGRRSRRGSRGRRGRAA